MNGAVTSAGGDQLPAAPRERMNFLLFNHEKHTSVLWFLAPFRRTVLLRVGVFLTNAV